MTTADTSPEPDAAERLAQIRDRSERLAVIPLETAASNYIMRDMIDSIGDVRWLLEQLKPQHGVQREGSNGASPARDEASAREQADMYSRVHEPGSLPTPYHVVQRYVTDWQRVDNEQRPEDGEPQ